MRIFSNPRGSTLLVLVNLLAGATLLGVVIYTQVLYKRPKITEESERKRLEAEQARKAALAALPGSISFDSMKVNIASDKNDRAGESTLKHMVSVTFSLEVRDIGKQSLVEKMKPVFLDEVISLLGGKTFEELTTVQGRYLLRSELIEAGNRVFGEPLVTNLYFSEFLVQ